MATNTGKGGARVGAGRKSLDGRKTVADVRGAVDQETLDVLISFAGESMNFGLAIRELAHAYLALKTTGGHCKPTTIAPAAAPEIVGGHADNITTRSGAGGAAKRRVVQPAPVEGAVTREAARQAAIDVRESNKGGLLSEYTRDGARKSMSKAMRDREAFARGERTAW